MYNDKIFLVFSVSDNEWKKTLFGPSGILTEMFNLINEKRKEDIKAKKSQKQADVLGKFLIFDKKKYFN